MAALPTAVQISADILSRKERADDIARLKSMMELHAWNMSMCRHIWSCCRPLSAGRCWPI